MYWSPDSSKLALLTITRGDDGSTAKAGGLAAPLPQEILLRWLIYDIKTDTLEVLTSFTPTLAFLQIVPYFDQYHRSVAPQNNVELRSIWVMYLNTADK
jgi:hypothetical protein